jgi:hypothetical protein
MVCVHRQDAPLGLFAHSWDGLVVCLHLELSSQSSRPTDLICETSEVGAPYGPSSKTHIIECRFGVGEGASPVRNFSIRSQRYTYTQCLIRSHLASTPDFQLTSRRCARGHDSRIPIRDKRGEEKTSRPWYFVSPQTPPRRCRIGYRESSLVLVLHRRRPSLAASPRSLMISSGQDRRIHRIPQGV